MADAQLWDESRACVSETRAILTTTRYRIAASHRRLNSTFSISGYADGLLPDSLRDRLLSGELPILLDSVSWGGPAAEQHTCSVCMGGIAKEQSEFEVKPDGVLFYAHPICFRQWAQESAALRQS